eukprot:CAMPEP_0198665712 /NCGR_PEP_ID=MMETSP1467-20131203/61724_1 /TAXON_ID=1462469 /ORGANISM="unid. sp., Strain CCMP2135" /LENGTH=42 /DNA_ID= /DNA_START= /DNA_END= /DNA_ORIENTATION=
MKTTSTRVLAAGVVPALVAGFPLRDLFTAKQAIKTQLPVTSG